MFHFLGQGRWLFCHCLSGAGEAPHPKVGFPPANHFPAIFQLPGLSAELETKFKVHSKHSTDSS